MIFLTLSGYKGGRERDLSNDIVSEKTVTKIDQVTHSGIGEHNMGGVTSDTWTRHFEGDHAQRGNRDYVMVRILIHWYTPRPV